MALTNKQLIKSTKIDLTEWMRVDPSLILQHVHSEQIITDAEYAGLKSIKDPDKANGELLDKVYDKGEETCKKFLLALGNRRIKETCPDLAKWIASLGLPGGSTTHGSVDIDIQITDKLSFLKKNRCSLIEKVKSTTPILDQLKQEGFNSERASKVAAANTEEAQMRMLLDSTTVKKQAERLIKALITYERDVMEELIADHQN